MEEPYPGSHIFIHYVIAVSGRKNTIHPYLREKLESCITAIAEADGHTPMCVSCMPDHCHVFVDLNHEISVENCVDDIQEKSALWVDEHLNLPEKFHWQQGYVAISVGLRTAPLLIDHLVHHEEYHLKHSFREECMTLLKENQMDCDGEGLFEFRD